MGLLLGLRGGTLAPSRLTPVTAATVDMLALDTFTDADATVLTSHTADDGGTWTKHPSSGAGDITIDGNRAHNADAAVSLIALHSFVPPSADVVVSCDVVLRSDNNLANGGVVARASASADTMYHARYTTNGNSWQVFRFVAGAATQIGVNVVQTLTVDQPYRLTLSIRGSAVTLRVDGAVMVSATDASPITSTGRCGLRVSQNATATTGVHFDTFQIRG